MNTLHPAKRAFSPAQRIKILCSAWFCASLVAVPNIADAAAQKHREAPVASQREAGPLPRCGMAQHPMGEAGGQAAGQGQSDGLAMMAIASSGETTCRLTAAAELSIRNNPGIF